MLSIEKLNVSVGDKSTNNGILLYISAEDKKEMI